MNANKIENDKKYKDSWDKLSASAKFLGAIAAILGSVLIPYHLHSNAEENRKAQMYAQIMTEREQADTSLRSEMFKTLLANYLGKFTDEKKKKEMDSKPPSVSEQETDETKNENILYNKIMFLSLLTKNFQEHFNVKPLFEQLYRVFKKEEDKILEKLFAELKSEEGKKLYREMKNANDEIFKRFYNKLKSQKDEPFTKKELKAIVDKLEKDREEKSKQRQQKIKNLKKLENNRTTTQESKKLEQELKKLAQELEKLAQELDKIDELIKIKELKEHFLTLVYKNGLKTFDELQEKTKKLIEKLRKIKELKGRLIRLARSTASKQATMLSRLGHVHTGELRFCKASVFKNNSKQESGNSALKHTKLDEEFIIKLDEIALINLYDTDREKSDNNSISKKSRYHSLELKVVSINEGADEVEFESKLYKGKSFDHKDPVGAPFIFSVSYFDMPYMDNTRLYNGTRFAVIVKDIERIDMDYVNIKFQVISFREEFMTLRDRPLFEEMLKKLR